MLVKNRAPKLYIEYYIKKARFKNKECKINSIVCMLFASIHCSSPTQILSTKTKAAVKVILS